MRTALLIIVAFLLPVLAFSQSKSSQRLFLKDGTAISGSIEIQDDGSYKVTTPAGDVFFFLPAEVKGIIDADKITTASKTSSFPKNPKEFFLGKAIASQIDSYSQGLVHRRQNILYFTETKEALTLHDFNTMEGWEHYMKASKKGKSGRIVAYCGGGSFLLGGLCVGIGFLAGDGVYLPAAGLFFAGAGLITGVTGLCITWSSNSQLNKIAKSYNQTPGYALNFGVQQHGIGLSLTF